MSVSRETLGAVWLSLRRVPGFWAVTHMPQTCVYITQESFYLPVVFH